MATIDGRICAAVAQRGCTRRGRYTQEVVRKLHVGRMCAWRMALSPGSTLRHQIPTPAPTPPDTPTPLSTDTRPDTPTPLSGQCQAILTLHILA